MTRGINGESASEKAHINTEDLPKETITSRPAPVNLPGPVQEAQEAVADLLDPVQPIVDSLTQRVPVSSTGETVDPIPEQDEEITEGNAPAKMLRTETADSVEIVGDVVA